MIKIIDCSNKNYLSVLKKILLIKQNQSKPKTSIVRKIIQDVRKNGDKALIKYEKKYSKNKNIVTTKKKYISRSKVVRF